MTKSKKRLDIGAGSVNAISKQASDWIRLDRETHVFERMEAFFSGNAYEPHRHDTYAIGRTLSGVQQFAYRGETRNGLPGSAIVLHPDELHDGHAGTDDGFLYRMIYVEPAEIQKALRGRPLPFIENGITSDKRVIHAVDALIGDMGHALEGLEFDDAIYDLSIALEQAANAAPQKTAIADYRAAERARELILCSLNEDITLEQLEQATGCGRWRLSRDFRAVFGTSPYRYLVMRRLDHVKQALRNGSKLVDAAFDAGFADQAHMTRHFSRTFGMTPSQWRRLTAA